MKSNLTIIKIVLTIAIIVSIGTALGATIYFEMLKNNPPVAVQPTIAPTITPTPISSIDISDWMTYRNEKYGYEVKYPKDWFYENRSVNEDNQRIVFFDYKKDDKRHIEVSVDPNNTLEKISEELSSLVIYNAPPITQKNTEFQGLNAIYATGDFLGYAESFFVEYDKNLYKIEYYIGNIKNKTEYETNIFNTMIESFKFVK